MIERWLNVPANVDEIDGSAEISIANVIRRETQTNIQSVKALSDWTFGEIHQALRLRKNPPESRVALIRVHFWQSGSRKRCGFRARRA
jgi:hypothetical protein